MCGIFFSIGFENLPASVIDSVSHRGPDGRGWNEFISSHGPVVMAHRRLAIIDLSDAGRQPMSSEDGRYWITYNGEIYNYLEIRKELKNLGHSFKTETDTEVLLKSYLQWGKECLHKFNGMFAFVIWDDKDKSFFAARDRFGVKPLYYYKQGDKIAFASEIKQFLGIPGFFSNLEQESLFFYLLGTYTNHSNKTFFQNVKQIKGGKYAVGNHQEGFKVVTWYDIERNVITNNNSHIEKYNMVKDILFDAVSLRLRSDVRVGSCLSGGIDSSSIVGIVSQILPAKADFKTFSACYPGDKVDEGFYIDKVSDKTKFANIKVYPDENGLLNEIEKLTYYHDQPIAGGTVYAQWSVFQKAKEHNVKVMLDGQGSDEIFSGYHSMLPSLHNEFLINGHWLRFWIEVLYSKKLHGFSLKTSFIRILEDCYPGIARAIARFKGHNFVHPWINKDFAAVFSVDPCSPSFKNLVDHEGSFKVKKSIDLSLLKIRYTLPSLLHFEDRNSMAHSIEARTPFLDYRLVEYALSLSAKDKIQNGVTKKTLRNAMINFLPIEVLNRQDKLGFAVPETKWMNTAKMKSYSREVIMNTIDMLSQFINKEQVSGLMNMNSSGQFYSLWPLFDLGIFLRKFNFKC